MCSSDLIVRGSTQAWDPGESESVADPAKPDWGTSTFVQNWDRSRGLTRTDWVRPRAGGPGLRYSIPMSVLPRLMQMNEMLDPLGRFHAVMSADALFEIEPAP